MSLLIKRTIGGRILCKMCEVTYPLSGFSRVCMTRSMNDDRGSYYPGYVCKICGTMFVDVEDFQE